MRTHTKKKKKKKNKKKEKEKKIKKKKRNEDTNNMATCQKSIGEKEQQVHRPGGWLMPSL